MSLIGILNNILKLLMQNLVNIKLLCSNLEIRTYLVIVTLLILDNIFGSQSAFHGTN